MAKRIIKLINAVGETVNNDPDVNRFLKVAFVPNKGSVFKKSSLPPKTFKVR